MPILSNHLLLRLAAEPWRSLIAGQGQDRSYLLTSGWARSFQEKAPVAGDGDALPWYTYPAIRFLESRIRADFRIFEFGAGNSTRWWAKRAAEVVSREHDAAWAARLREGGAPPNVRIDHFEMESPSYVSAPEGKFHIIVIDGRRRVECARNALTALTPDGVIVWDNSDRERYREGYELLAENGFRRLDFWGVVPGGVKEISTTIFYKQDNCLGI